MGRPKKYTDEIIEKHGEQLVKFVSNPKCLWLKDYCIEQGFPAEYLSVWESEHKEFSQSLKKAKDIQESHLVKEGFKKGSNVAFVIFTLKNVAKWRDIDPTDKSGLNDEDVTRLKQIAKKEFEENL